MNVAALQSDSWIITVENNSKANENIEIIRCIGTAAEVKKYLFSLVERDRSEDDKYIEGTDDLDDIDDKDGMFYAYTIFFGNGADYVARRESSIETVKL